MWRSLAILLAIGLGLLVPAAGRFTFLIRYLLMAMLLASFLEVRFSWSLIRRQHLWVVAGNLLIPMLVFALFSLSSRELGLAAFAIAAAPTAAAAPVMAGFLRRDVSFVTAAVLTTSPVLAVALPFMLSFVLGGSSEVDSMGLALPVISLVFIPLLLSIGLRYWWPRAVALVLRYRQVVFLFFLLNVFVAAGSASAFLRSQESSAFGLFAQIALAMAALCLFQFRLGEWMGRRQLPIEMGLALGRKNTMFGIWMSLAFISPVAALGPMFYILFQNMYNSWQLYALPGTPGPKA